MRRALVVGIDDYAFGQLSGCVNDARSMTSLLERHADGAPNFDCKTLTVPSQSITRASLKQSILDLFRYDAEVALFYFSGHGTSTDFGGYLVTPDATTNDEGVPMADLLTAANTSPAREVIVILDCCNSGSMGEVPAINNQNANVREGMSVLTASRADQPSVEETAGLGLFTSLVCDALRGGAADVLGQVTIAGIYAYAEQALGPWEQRPLMKSHVSTLTSLRQCGPNVKMEIIREIPTWFPDPDYELPLDPSYEPDAAPSHPEHEEVFGKLQKCRGANLVEPVGEEHMYYAAMNSKGCRLTALGRHYRRLVVSGRI